MELIDFSDQYKVKITCSPHTNSSMIIWTKDYPLRYTLVFANKGNGELDWERFKKESKSVDLTTAILSNQKLLEFCNRIWKNRKFD